MSIHLLRKSSSPCSRSSRGSRVDQIQVNVGGRETVVRFLSREDLVRHSFSGTYISVCDEHTESLLRFGEKPYDLVLPPGEEHKNLLSVQSILDTALSSGCARDSLILALGGGVICDMAGFAASVFMRGMRLILVPSTLLSMVDASIGGKTGIDYGGFKNMVGSFYPAEEVLICVDLLGSLPESEYRSGLAEVLKHGFLKGGKFLSFLESERAAVLSRHPDALRGIVFDSLAVKKEYIETDPFERGIRSHLNLGHTFGHALESVLGFSGVSHGAAVAWGMALAMDAGLALGITESSYAERVKELLSSYGFRLSFPAVDVSDLIAAMKADKKKKGGEVRFVLQECEARTLTRLIPDEVLASVLKRQR